MDRAPETRELFPGAELRPDERLLWEGRPGFGISRFELKRLLRSGLSVAATGFLVVAAYVGMIVSDAFSLEAALLVVSAGFFLAVVPTLIITFAVLLAKISRASAAATGTVIFCVPLLALLWIGLVQDVGLEGAFAGLVTHPIGVCIWTLAVPVVPASIHLGRRVLTLVHTRYYLTNQRYFQTLARHGAAEVVQTGEVPTGWIQVRAIPFGDGHRGHIAIGTGRSRVLFPFIEHPKLVVEEIRRELEQLGRAEPEGESTGADSRQPSSGADPRP